MTIFYVSLDVIVGGGLRLLSRVRLGNENKICLERRVRGTAFCLLLNAQVNRELKKLLVASLGEDLEARVHFLSEDKAQLAADVRAYAQRLTQGREEIDRLAIHADVWRSKFLAAR